ncbi:1360_t:CDS:1, partial [Dentiscutata heterogama]
NIDNNDNTNENIDAIYDKLIASITKALRLLEEQKAARNAPW